MITGIHLEHFKCFEGLELPLSDLSVLTGLNASGKSSVMQALVLLHQTIVENEYSQSLILNGRSVALGAADEILNKLSGRSSFVIGVRSRHISLDWRIRAQGEGPMSGRVEEVSWKVGDPASHSTIQVFDDDIEIRKLLPVGKSDEMGKRGTALIESLRLLSFVSADRIGPQETYPASSYEQYWSVGARGEYTPWYIHALGELAIPSSMCLEGSPPNLERQVDAWLRHFFPGSRLRVEAIPRTNLVTMSMSTSDATDFHRPVNVGYGLSHTLPILVACLGAVGHRGRGEDALTVLIENPELHLHPAGQSRMGLFLARTAAAGVQVILETHSDHVLNGIRRAVRNEILAPEQVSLHFFASADGEAPQQVLQPRIFASGGIEPWPEGFFDQLDRDLIELL
jgi:predicted ATPase